MGYLVELLGDLEIDHPVFKYVEDKMSTTEGLDTLLEENANIIMFVNALSVYDAVENEPDTRESKAFRNLLKILAIEYADSNYFCSRLGWWIWFMVCYAKHDAYYKMRWYFSADPLNWYRHDEPARPQGMEVASNEDPFNIRGKCWIHPEWYKDTAKLIEE